MVDYAAGGLVMDHQKTESASAISRTEKTAPENDTGRRLLTIQDISCIGKCSLTIALPVISAMGVETAVLPTALLSAHTMFQGFTYLDLTDQMEPITDHWKRVGIAFDTIYTGYLGSLRQMDLVRGIFRKFSHREHPPLIVIDPVMADYGKLYSGFDETYAKKNAEFCGCADVILPNLTEAHFMTGLPYLEKYDRGYILEVLRALCSLGPRWAVLTGISFEEGKTGVMAENRETGEIFSYFTDRVPANYHGTGDLFASVVAGAMTRGASLQDALKLAVRYVRMTIEVTYKSGRQDAYGVDFETTLPALMKAMGPSEKYSLPS